MIVNKLLISNGFYPREFFCSTADYIASVQKESGSIPWYPGGLIDPWDHIESAMGLTTAGLYQEAKMAFTWLKDSQEPDGGFWPAYADCSPLDKSRKEAHHPPYIATGMWHYYLITGDYEFLLEMWPNIEAGIDFACNLQSREGDIYWALLPDGDKWDDALVTGCCSILKSLECSILIARALGEYKSEWIIARERLKKALNFKPHRFDRYWESKSRYSMDWFYPVLSGAYSKSQAKKHLDKKWDRFVKPEIGCKCVSDEPWITVAESCELILALLATDNNAMAARLFSWLHWQRDEQGAYWTGYQTDLGIYWPDEKPTWTSAAVLLAADALSNTTAASHLFTRDSLSEFDASFELSTNAAK